MYDQVHVMKNQTHLRAMVPEFHALAVPIKLGQIQILAFQMWISTVLELIYHVPRIQVFRGLLSLLKLKCFYYIPNTWLQNSYRKRILKLLSVISKCHRLILRSSAERYVSWSLFTEIEFMWYVCALANILLGLASTIRSMGFNIGT